jgi:hypothetical protein
VLASLAAGAPATSGLLAGLGGSALSGTLSPLVRAVLDQRSVASRLSSIRTPVYLFQGREDYVFDVDQALLAYARLRGPKRLYVGDFGHAPASFASADFPGYVISESVRWFDRWLRGRGSVQPAVVLADQTGKRRRTFAKPPATVVVHAGRAARALETFGDSTVRVSVSALDRYPRLVAVVLAGQRVVTHGAVVPRVGLNTIRLADYAVQIPAGVRITVRLGPDGGALDPAYAGVPSSGTIGLGEASLDLRVLR